MGNEEGLRLLLKVTSDETGIHVDAGTVHRLLDERDALREALEGVARWIDANPVQLAGLASMRQAIARVLDRRPEAK